VSEAPHREDHPRQRRPTGPALRHEEGIFDVKMAAGSRWRSVVDTTEVVIVRAPNDEATLECGGQTMVAIGSDAEAQGAIDPEHGAGTQLGKRYCDDKLALEVLCTKAGDGSLAVSGRALQLKGAKPLPSSD
jgi:hypothetical protein